LQAIMIMRPISAFGTAAVTSLVLALWLLAYGSHAQGPAPFENLAGQWSGSGTIDLASGAQEPIKCRAAYDVLDQQNNLQLDIRCASQSYNFELRASANYNAGAITGTWSEATRNAAGTISGNAKGERFEITAKSSSFTASLTLTTRGDRQSVVIQSQEAQTTVKGASITLQRSS
jgi:hypothetical protein